MALDLSLPGMNGAELLRTVRNEELDVKVLLLTGHTPPGLMADAVLGGPDGLLSKHEGCGEICNAIVSTAYGEGASRATAVLDRAVGCAERRPRLSGREAEVLALVADGQTMAAIAHRLGIRKAAAEATMRRVREKLGASRNAEAVAKAIRLGLIP